VWEDDMEGREWSTRRWDVTCDADRVMTHDLQTTLVEHDIMCQRWYGILVWRLTWRGGVVGNWFGARGV